MKQFTRFNGLAIAGGRLFAATYHSVSNAFGLQ